MKKRLLAVLLAIAVILSMIPAYAEDGQNVNIIKYQVDPADVEYNGIGYLYFNEDGCLVSCDKNIEIVRIPDEVEGIKVTSIGRDAFEDCGPIYIIEIGKGITKIDAYFNHSCNVDTFRVAADNPVFEVREGVLFNKVEQELICYPQFKVTDVYEIPEGTKKVADYAFSEIDNHQNTVIVPPSVERIGYNAFKYGNIKKIIYSEGIDVIDSSIFSLESWGMYEAVFPESIERIEEDCFNESYLDGHSFIASIYEGSFAEEFFKTRLPHITTKLIIPEKKEQIIYCSDRKVTYGCSPFNLGAEAKTELSYMSLNEDIAVVSDDGTVNVNGTGKAVVSITAAETGEYLGASKKIEIVVEPGALIEQSIDCKDIFKVYTGDGSFVLDAKAVTALSYHSENEDVATVTYDGTVNPVAPGSTDIVISARAENGYGPAVKRVRVEVAKRAQEIKGVDEEYHIYVVGSLKINPWAQTAVTYESDNEEVAEITSDGRVNTKKAGSAVITIKAEENFAYLPAEIKTTVYAEKRSQAINGVNDYYETKYGVPVTIKPSANTKISYESRNGVADVDKYGKITPHYMGDAKILVRAAETDEYYEAQKLITIHVLRAGQSITSKSSYSKAVGDSFSLGAKAKSELRYSSSNSKVAAVSSSGKVTVKKTGTAYITITAVKNSRYDSATKKVKVRAGLKKPGLKVSALKGHKNKITWTKVPGASGYKLYLYDSKKKKYRCVLTKSSKIKSVTHRGLKKGKTYRYKVRAYATVNGKKVYSPYSSVRKVKAR